MTLPHAVSEVRCQVKSRPGRQLSELPPPEMCAVASRLFTSFQLLTQSDLSRRQRLEGKETMVAA